MQTLLGFSVRLMFPTIRAELLHLETLSSRPLIFRFAVIPVLAFAALELNDFSWHL